jgi:hypothetical protein
MVAAGLAAGSTLGLVGALAVSDQGGLLVASGGKTPVVQSQVQFAPATAALDPATAASGTGGTDPTVAVPTTTAPPVTVTTAPPVTQSQAS